MKTIILEKVNMNKLYLFSFLSIIIYVVVLIISMYFIVLIFPEFDGVNLYILVTAIIYANYSFKYSYSKSSEKIKIELNQKKIKIGEKKIFLTNLDSIKFKKMFLNYYPSVNLQLKNNQKIQFRVNKNVSFLNFVSEINKLKKDI